MKIALAGNPNSGKTTIFNNLTGARQRVGNYPGVTVDKKEGSATHEGHQLSVVDLPGTYSLTAYSIEELVARDFIINEKPDVVVDVIDASNLERNLYLAVQLIELGVPLVLAFNMSDVAAQRGMKFDLELLSKLLGTPIILTVGHKRKGHEELLETAMKVAHGELRYPPVRVSYGKRINRLLDSIEALVEADPGFTGRRPARWVALKLLENDSRAFADVKSTALAEAVQQGMEYIHKLAGDSPETVIAERRYGFISGACQEAVRTSVELRHDWSDRIDAVMTNKVLGLPIFLGLMWLMFKFTFVASEPFMGWIEAAFAFLGESLGQLLPQEGALHSLVVDGIIGGVGGVLVFVPIIGLLFLFMAVLEATGYMARAAFIMDKYMHKVGLHGQSFIPMILGFGCTVPGIMACRVIPDRRDRLVTVLVLPFMSCGRQKGQAGNGARPSFHVLWGPPADLQPVHWGALRREWRHGPLLALRSRDTRRASFGKTASQIRLERRRLATRDGASAISGPDGSRRSASDVGAGTDVSQEGRDNHPARLGPDMVPEQLPVGTGLLNRLRG